MVLMNLTVDGSGGFFVTLLDNVLLNDCGSNLFVDCGVVVTSLVPAGNISAVVHEKLTSKQHQQNASRMDELELGDHVVELRLNAVLLKVSWSVIAYMKSLTAALALSILNDVTGMSFW